MYSFLSAFLLVGVLMVLAGFVGKLATDGVGDVSSHVASALGLIVVFALLVVTANSPENLLKKLEAVCGGVPFLNDIADYGSLQKIFTQNPTAAAQSFLDTVLLATIINLLSLLPLTQGSAVNDWMVKLFTGIVLALIALFLLNFVISKTEVYHWMVSAIGVIISVIAVGGIPLAVISAFSNKTVMGAGIISALLMFSKSKIAGIFRDAFLKALVYVLGIWIMERYFGSLAAGIAQIVGIITVGMPLVIMMVGIVIVLKSTK